MFQIAQSVLIVIDVQGKLAKLVYNKLSTYRHLEALIHASQILNIPILYTEQVPEKIGKTIPVIARILKPAQPIVKSSFSCCGSKEFVQQLNALNRKQIIVTGIETHVCVYQTVADLLERFQVQVVADAVSSRTAENTQVALRRMEKLGAEITTTEMIICELLQTSKHEKFREIIKLIK